MRRKLNQAEIDKVVSQVGCEVASRLQSRILVGRQTLQQPHTHRAVKRNQRGLAPKRCLRESTM